MNELHFAFKARQHLNRGLHELPPATHARLQAAREQALARRKTTVQQSLLATAGSFIQEHGEGLHIKQMLVALAVVVGVASYTYWQADQNIAELELIDSALLADDLPIAAFTDRGFDAWLKSSASQ
ncbi:DUF3619 family protein [Accumulibacter sp.]|uniref:DUF3619 family protein n=1 Tax=Accumulibacter sp. TaxID=2053492 RepID=UPI001E0BC56E|nr:DUF3619 family protein [Accumulibacter sp.]MCB1967651.1 DUF3619 family protein [Accumulibacter sp.]MCP5229701.1 DUF3619 family protein [Accumulibacter sp.]